MRNAEKTKERHEDKYVKETQYASQITFTKNTDKKRRGRTKIQKENRDRHANTQTHETANQR